MKKGLLILFSGRPAAGKTTVVLKLVSLLEKYGRVVRFIEFDHWRKKNFGKHAFDEKLLNKILIRLNLEIKNIYDKNQIIIVESGGTTANFKTRTLIIKNICNVFDVRIECSFLTSFLRDITRSWCGQVPRMKFLYLQTIIKNIFQKKKIYLAGFNKPLEKISGLYISVEKISADRAAEKIFKDLYLNCAITG